MFWHPKIDNEQSRVLGGDAAYQAGDRDRETVWKRKS